MDGDILRHEDEMLNLTQPSEIVRPVKDDEKCDAWRWRLLTRKEFQLWMSVERSLLNI